MLLQFARRFADMLVVVVVFASSAASLAPQRVVANSPQSCRRREAAAAAADKPQPSPDKVNNNGRHLLVCVRNEALEFRGGGVVCVAVACRAIWAANFAADLVARDQLDAREFLSLSPFATTT